MCRDGECQKQHRTHSHSSQVYHDSADDDASRLPELSGDVDAESHAAWAKRYDSFECAICLEKWRAGDHLVLTQPCSHLLHSKCLDAWAMKGFEDGAESVSCPVCRQTVQSERHLQTSAFRSAAK